MPSKNSKPKQNKPVASYQAQQPAILQFTTDNFQQLCHQLAAKDAVFTAILGQYSYPPMWTRPASFATLIHIILEQQVSLASAKAAFNKLKEKLGAITPTALLKLSDEEMKACYFSRQKMVYARHLAEALLSKKIQLKQLSAYADDDIKTTLKQVKGIGDWTADVYLLFALQRTDVFPIGDLAMVNALKEVKQLPKQTSREEILLLAEAWRPYRSIAAMLLWHHYIKTRNIKF
jgi:DNA-3-methyladenine glycosylase II